ncbi:spore coat protein [bacterium 1xD42-67]|nr:spore coat protein [bacterium 1xD42-67]
MANLTTKELTALSDQLDFERVLHCKYLSAVQESQDQELKSRFQSCAEQHLQNYNTLLTYLR